MSCRSGPMPGRLSRWRHAALCKLEAEGPGNDTAVCARGSVATSVDGAAIAGRTDCNISRISVNSRRRYATVASDAASCCCAIPVVAAGAMRAVGTSGDAVTRGGRPSVADRARCRADCHTGAMLQHQIKHERSKMKNHCVVPMNINLYYGETVMHVAQS